MKKTITILILFILATSITAQDNSNEQIIVPLSNPDGPGLLITDHIKGSIKVIGYDGLVVIINAVPRQSENSLDRDSSDGLKRLSSNLIQINAFEKDNEITIHSNSHRGTIDLEIRVPTNFSLKLKTYYNGEIHVQYVTGELEITNINGDVHLESISGSAVVNTIDGDIFALFKEVTPDVPMAFTSIEGKIDLTFPADMEASLKMKSENGEIFSDTYVLIEKRKTEIDRSDETGIYKVSLEEWTQGTINGGGPEILVKTLEGSIYIRKQE